MTDRELQLGIVSAVAMIFGAGLLFGAAGAGGGLLLFGFIGVVIVAAGDLDRERYPFYKRVDRAEE